MCRIHDFTANSVYSAIAAVNRLAGVGSRQMLAPPGGDRRDDD